MDIMKIGDLRTRGRKKVKRGVGKVGSAHWCHEGECDAEGHLRAEEWGEEADTSRGKDVKNCVEFLELEYCAKKAPRKAQGKTMPLRDYNTEGIGEESRGGSDRH